MSTKRKISVIKILQLVVTLVATTACIIAISSASRIQDNKTVKNIVIKVRNDKYHFIDKEEISEMLLKSRHVDITKVKAGKVDVRQMESIIDANPWVADAQVYLDNNKVLHVNVTQRVPVARLFEQNGNSYYLDHTLKAMPLSTKYSYYATVFTNVPVLRNDSVSKAFKAEIVAIARHIDKDSFWSAQVSQVVVNEDHTFDVLPILGNHNILIGDTARLSEKFGNLFGFYKKVLNRIGWDKYEVLDARFAGQVVASPALPWKMPVDKSIANISWVKSIIDAAPKTTESDTPTTKMVTAIPAPVASGKQVVKPAVPATTVAKPAEKPTVVKPAEQKPAVIKPATAKPNIAKPPAAVTKAKAPEKKAATTKKVGKPTVKADNKKTGDKAKEKQKTTKDSKETSPKYIYHGNDNQ